MKRILHFIFSALVVLGVQPEVVAQIRYKVELLPDGVTYQVSLKPDVTYSGVAALTSTAQVTMIVPTGGFVLQNLQSIHGIWSNNTNVTAPLENSGSDYLIVGLISLGTNAIPYQMGQETPLFTFTNGGICTGSVELMEADDPFLPPNSVNINAGNEAFIFGYGNSNAWVGNYGQGSALCTVLCPKPIEYSVKLLPDGHTYQVSLRSQFTYTGINALTNSAQVSLLVPTGGFELSNLQSINGLWANNTTVIAPSENPGYDYILIGLINNGTTGIPYNAGQETPLFTFENSGICTGAMELMEAGDPFYPPNQQQINAGNEIVIFGFGNQNAWCGNYGQGNAVCETPGCIKPIEYTIRLLEDGETYQVSLRSTTTYAGVNALTNSALVCIVVPTGGFFITNLQNQHGLWSNNTNVLAPTENPGFDYLLVGLTNNGTNGIPYVAGQETPLFTFKNGGICTGPVTLMEAEDVFYPPNSQQINAGNEIVLFGFGNQNAWCGNYGDPIPCFVCEKPIVYKVQLLEDGETYLVSLKSYNSYTGVSALTNSAQVTLLAPTGGFVMDELQSINGLWSNNTNVISPSENPDYDYFFVGLINNGTPDIPYQAGEEVPLFTFKNSGACTGDIFLMEADDSFYPPNSTGLNAGNEIVIFGYGNQNAWCGNYGGPAHCIQYVTVSPRVFLQGAYDPNTHLMYDSLRVRGYLPLTEPYTILVLDSTNQHPFQHINGGGNETTFPVVLVHTQEKAIVDWVFLELRSEVDSTVVLATRSALLRRDGEIVDVDGESPVVFMDMPPQPYFVAVRHRNHLGAMSATAIYLDRLTTHLHFSDPSFPTYGDHARLILNDTIALLRAGNAYPDRHLRFDEDTDAVHDAIANNPDNTGGDWNFWIEGYFTADCNLDGNVVFQGPQNDLLHLFLNILFHPLNNTFNIDFVVQEQLP